MSKEPLNPEQRKANKERLAKQGFKKGVSGNPNGGRAHNTVIKALRKLTISTYREVIELALTSDIESLKELVLNPKTPAVQVGIATALLRAIKSGDWDILERIAARIVGKIPDELKVTSTNESRLSVIDENKLKMAIAKIESDV